MSRQKLLHILGGGPWQLPTIRRARELGHRVLVTDVYPERPGYALADLHEVMDITDGEGTLAVSRRHGIDGILCDTTDTGVKTAAHVAEHLGLAGIGRVAAAGCTDKSAMRAAAQACGLPGPTLRVLDAGQNPAAAAAEVGFPLVVKPVDNQSGRGVKIVHEPAQLAAAVARARAHSRSGRVLLERLVPGVEHIVDGFVVGGVVQVLGIAEKRPYADNPTISSRILYLCAERFAAVHRVVAPGLGLLLSSLQLRDGIFHAEFMVQGDTAVPIDLAARGGGVMIYTHVLPAVSGVDAVSAMIACALGLPLDVKPRFTRSACIEFLRAPVGRIQALAGKESALAQPGVAGLHFSAEPGDEVAGLDQKDDRPGFVIGVGENEEQALAAVARARATLSVHMAGQPRPQSFD